ncbi:MAG: D-arabinose 5-phosphate isomerase, partial [Gammaproteobacteria bacterium]|nr:D-arabinose 5-phosphate isomerase [Gammaproteobacteria bacterium]
MNREQIIQMGRAVVDTETAAIQALKSRIDDQFVRACEYMLNCRGRI